MTITIIFIIIQITMTITIIFIIIQITMTITIIFIIIQITMTITITVKSRPIAHGRLAFRAPLTRGWAIAREFQVLLGVIVTITEHFSYNVSLHVPKNKRSGRLQEEI